jgi:hypothetical protein
MILFMMALDFSSFLMLAAADNTVSFVLRNTINQSASEQQRARRRRAFKRKP